MSGQLAFSYVVRYQDQASSQAGAALRTVERGLGAVDRAARTTNTALRDTETRIGSTGRAAVTAATQLERVGSSRAAAGIAAVGRQADATTASIQRMTREASAGARALGLVTGTGQLIAGAAAARAVAARPVSETMGYDRRLANLANTAYSEESLAKRQARMREIDSGLMAAVRAGGGTREGALEAYNKLVGSGVKPDEAMRVLPTLVKFGTAADADPTVLADIAVKGKQTFGLTDFSAALDMAMRAGQLGGFELKDMAKWLPQQMAAGRTAGMKGEKDFIAMLVAAQGAVVTAGSRDEAGNNLVNLLAKINSADTANDAKKLKLDSAGSLADARAKGTGALDAFVNMVELVMQKDARYVALRAKAKNATGEEQKDTFQAMTDIMAGSAIGKLIQDRQALMALVGVMQQRYDPENNTAQMREKVANAKNTGQAAFDLIASTPSFKAEMLAAEKANAMQAAMDKVNPTLGDLADKAVSLAREFPNLTAGAVAATTALTALAAGAGVASLAGKVLGLGGAGAAAAGAAGAAGAATGAAGLGAGASALLASGALAAGGALGYGLYSMGRGTKIGDGFGDMVLEMMAFFGSQKAQQDLVVIRQLEAAAAQQKAADELRNRPPVVVNLDGRQIYSSVSEIADEQARRR